MRNRKHCYTNTSYRPTSLKSLREEKERNQREKKEKAEEKILSEIPKSLREEREMKEREQKENAEEKIMGVYFLFFSLFLFLFFPFLTKVVK